MKDTNAIEKALKNKIDFEVENIVRGFINELTKLYNTYGGTNWYTIVHSARGYDKEQEITCLTKANVRSILEKMIKENHGEAMLNKKSKELLAKLEIL
jgi:hypothetical protein